MGKPLSPKTSETLPATATARRLKTRRKTHKAERKNAAPSCVRCYASPALETDSKRPKKRLIFQIPSISVKFSLERNPIAFKFFRSEALAKKRGVFRAVNMTNRNVTQNGANVDKARLKW
jgi:hypothetical protein